MKRAVLLFTLLISSLVHAQLEGNNWYFGENAGLNFSTTPPTALNDGAMSTLEGCTTISDALGNLLFYSDGVTVWDRTHQPMPNGTGLTGHRSSVQSSIAVKDLSTSNRWYIFTIGQGGNAGLAYSMIDMNLNSGLGDVVVSQKNVPINNTVQEKIAFTRNANNDGYWLLTFSQSTYYAYRVDNGIVWTPTPVISTIPQSSILQDRRGVLKFSPDGNKIINTSVGDVDAGILTFFNKQTGVVHSPFLLSAPNGFPFYYGAEFSPDSRMIYVNANSSSIGNTCNIANTHVIYQFFINSSSSWNSSPYVLAVSNSTRGSLQLAPDGKIYVARNCENWLGVINTPTVAGIGANYVHNGIQLAPNTSAREGLPNTGNAYYYDSYNEIEGIVTADIDLNGCSTTDPKYSGLFFEFASNNYTTVGISQNDGFYNLVSPNGIFTLTPHPENPSYWNFSPTNVTVDFPTQASPFTQDFCVTPNGSIEDLEVYVLPLEQARPGFETDYMVRIKNKGNQIASGTVTLNYENDYMTLFSSIPTAAQPANNQLSWSFSNLQPFQMEEYQFTMTLNPPTDPNFPLNGNDILSYTGAVTGQGTDAMPSDNTMVFDQTVVNAFDPNDKTCLQGETIDPNDVGEYVHYMIRFENTGTASAINVVIKDEIDLSKFDLTTLVPLGGSHDYFIRIREGNIVEFIHENINLDFNDATNDGHVLFKIKTLNTLSVGDTFDNQAGIYFDYNAPIITNNELTTIESTASTVEVTDESIQLFPNPASSFINVSSDNSIETIAIIDINGRMLSMQGVINNSAVQKVDLSQLGSGAYFIQVTTSKGKAINKILVE